jgi:hypothetical protein
MRSRRLLTAVSVAAAVGAAALATAAPAAAAAAIARASRSQGEILYLGAPSAGSIYPGLYAVSPAGTGRHRLYVLDTEDSVFSAAFDNGELLYLQSTGNGQPATFVERYPDGKIAHRFRFFPKGRFSVDTGGPGLLALSASGATAAIIASSPYYNDGSLFIVQAATGKIIAEPIRATKGGKRELSDVSWGPAAGELTVGDENPRTGHFEIQVLRFNGSVVRTYASAGTENGSFDIAPGSRQILYTCLSNINGNQSLVSQAASGSRPRQLANGFASQSPLIVEPWSPGDARFAYGLGANWGFPGSGQIYISSPGGASRHRLAGVIGWYPMWVDRVSA